MEPLATSGPGQNVFLLEQSSVQTYYGMCISGCTNTGNIGGRIREIYP